MRSTKEFLKTRRDKIDFLTGLRNGTRALEEIRDLQTLFIGDEDEITKFKAMVEADQRYNGKTLFFLPDNGRGKRLNPDIIPEKSREL